MKFAEDYQRRLRAVAGVKDPTVLMVIDSEVERAYSTGCDTCGYGGGEDTVEYWVRADGQRYGGRKFTSLPSVLEALDEVPDA